MSSVGVNKVSLRKIWLIVLIVVPVIAIAINTLILTFLTDRYFSEYLTESYHLHVDQILSYTTSALSSQDYNINQMAIELEAHINDPITEIKVYDVNGELIADVGDGAYMRSPMMNGGMMSSRMMDRIIDNTSQETRQFELADAGGQDLGTVNITIHSLAENSFVARRFKSALLVNSFLAIVITIGISILIGIKVSARMSRSMKETEALATDIQLGKEVSSHISGIREVNGIRNSLIELNRRLRVKQMTRKSLIDQLVHQTRTPLTILQSHLEAIEDGIVQPDDHEMMVCQNQIADIKAIIANMSSMIDAGSEIDTLSLETFDLETLLLQIKDGLKAQFLKKEISFIMKEHEKVSLTTDRYKLSQALYNIVTNAYKYTSNGGEVIVDYSKKEDYVMLTIKDNGQGIKEDEIAKVFDAYYRTSSVSEVGGDGLGLYIVRENIERIGGTVELSSQVGVGTTVRIMIPLVIRDEGEGK